MHTNEPTTRLTVVSAILACLVVCIVFAGTAAGQTKHDSGRNVYLIDLTTALRLAGSNNLQIAEAEARVREVSGEKLSAYERFFPSLSAEWLLVRHEGRDQATEGDFLNVDKQFNRAGGRLSATWDLNDALFSVLAAHRQVESAEHARDNTTDSTLVMVANSYFSLALADVKIRIARRAVDASSSFVDQSQSSVREGVGFQVDVLRAKTQLAHDRLSLQRAQEDAATVSARLTALLNLEEPVTLTPLDSVVVPLALADTTRSVEEWIKQAVEHHPNAEAHRTQLATARIGKTQSIWGPLLPDIQGQALFGSMGPTWSDLQRSRDYSISLRWTIGPGGLLDFGRIKTRTGQLESADLRYEATRDAVAEQVVRSYRRLQVRAAMLGVAHDGLVVAEETVRLSKGRRDLGVGVALEVITAAEALTRAETDYAQAVVDYNRAQIEALAVLGQLRSFD